MMARIKLCPDPSVKMNNGKVSRRRVVVSGIGVISPNGIGVEAFWQATRSGISGIDTISLFDPSSLSCQIAGQVKSFRPENYLPPKELKRVGRAVSLAIAATKEALKSAHVDAPAMSLEERRGWGVILGSGGGTPGFIDPERASRPFDRLRDGFVLGEGAWILVLEEREQALSRDAPIYAEVLGYGSTCDAYHAVRLDPSGEEPARAMALALQDAGLAKDDIGYLALHGTSTFLNDKTETLAVKICFGPRADQTQLSSIKSM